MKKHLVSCGRCFRFCRRCRRPAQALPDVPDAEEGYETQPAASQGQGRRVRTGHHRAQRGVAAPQAGADAGTVGGVAVRAASAAPSPPDGISECAGRVEPHRRLRHDAVHGGIPRRSGDPAHAGRRARAVGGGRTRRGGRSGRRGRRTGRSARRRRGSGGSARRDGGAQVGVLLIPARHRAVAGAGERHAGLSPRRARVRGQGCSGSGGWGRGGDGRRLRHVALFQRLKDGRRYRIYACAGTVGAAVASAAVAVRAVPHGYGSDSGGRVGGAGRVLGRRADRQAANQAVRRLQRGRHMLPRRRGAPPRGGGGSGDPLGLRGDDVCFDVVKRLVRRCWILVPAAVVAVVIGHVVTGACQSVLRRPLLELDQGARRWRRPRPPGARLDLVRGAAPGLGQGPGPLLWRGGTGGSDWERREAAALGARGSVYDDDHSEGEVGADLVAADGPHPDINAVDVRGEGDADHDDTRAAPARQPTAGCVSRPNNQL